MLYEYHGPPWVAWRDAHRSAFKERGGRGEDQHSLDDVEQFEDTNQKDPEDDTPTHPNLP